MELAVIIATILREQNPTLDISTTKRGDTAIRGRFRYQGRHVSIVNIEIEDDETPVLCVEMRTRKHDGKIKCFDVGDPGMFRELGELLLSIGVAFDHTKFLTSRS